MEEGLVMTMVLVLGLAAMISTASPNQGQHFPELRTYSENQVETVTCPRSCSRDGDSVTFCIFNNATRHLYSYLYESQLLDSGNDCDGRTSGNGTAFVSFRVQPRMSGCTIYCVQRLRHCSSLVHTLIPPLLISVEAENRCNNSPTLSPTPSPTPSPTLISSATSPLTSTSPATPTSTPTPATRETSIPPATPTTSAEYLSSPLQTRSSSPFMPNFTPAMTGTVKSPQVEIAMGVFIAGLLLGVTCGIGITLIVIYRMRRQQQQPASTASSSQELDMTHVAPGSGLGDSESVNLSQH